MGAAKESQLPGLSGFDPVSIQPWTVKVVVVMTVLALVFVGLRLLSRYLKKQALWWDDYMIIFSMLWNLVVVGFIFAMHDCGMGLHADLVDPSDLVMMAKWLLVAEILYAWNLGWTKLSLLLMYYRIFRVSYFKKMAWAVGAFVMAWVVCVTFLFIFICVPVQKLWYPELPGRCIDQVGTWISNAASTLFTDLIILCLPIPQIWRLQLSKREKIGLTMAFGLGFFVVFASAYRTSVLFTYSSTDPSYTLAPTVGWTEIEMSAGIISACLPTLLPIINYIARRFGIRTPLSRAVHSDGRSKQSSSAPESKGNLTDVSTKRSSNNFYRLPDEEHDNAPAPIDSNLRPDGKEYGYTIKTTGRGGKDDDSGDDIPLRGIRVRTDFERTTMKK
ncbi:hypothetical protein GMORB2_2647 [Geosmithia morbida]|uniref:Rhodopsin domain-containing protein n=1 Tax=Geosmithia morbida TaxID=1094350 RepID=A0A9P4YTC2_9HYPO|nr:uncharacterized protein GMORB2_2647 [Geosmithia morbida]KAF4120644.1 hypothetical protein GMORB2_2647 [Geosmithia morbida]